MTIDHSSDFDARRIGWWQRRGVVRRIRRSTGLTAADRELRVQQARAAQTRGELNALTRGLDPAVGAAPGVPTRTPPREASPPPVRSQTTPPAPPTAEPRRSGRKAGPRILLGVVVAFFVFATSIVGCVSSLVRSADFSFDSGGSSPDLETSEGWSQMLDAFAEQTDISETLELFVSRSATLSVADPDDASRVLRYSFDGDVTQTVGLSRSWSSTPFDASQIDGDVIESAIDRAREQSGAEGLPEPLRITVRVTDPGTGSQIAVSSPTGEGGTYRLVVDETGETISEYP